MLHDDQEMPENKELKPVYKMLHKLKIIVFNNFKNKKIRNGNNVIKTFLKICELIIERKQFLTDKLILYNLHDLMVELYPKLNEWQLSKKTPLIRIVLHNELMPWLTKIKIKKGTTIIHADTHPDNNIPDEKVPKKLVSKRGIINKKVLLKVFNTEIGIGVTSYLLYYKPKYSIWCIPRWNGDTTIINPEYLTIDKKREMDLIQIKSETKKDKYSDCDRMIDPPIKKKNFFYLHYYYAKIKVKSDKFCTKIKKLLEDYPNKKYILDIDLDFFTTNGEKYKKNKYIKEQYDTQSFYRVTDYTIDLTPRDAFDNKKLNNKYKKEYKAVVSRIKRFCKGLKKLKKSKIEPRAVIFSDSTNSFMSTYNNAVLTNNYCPKMFVPLIHYHLLKELN